MCTCGLHHQSHYGDWNIFCCVAPIPMEITILIGLLPLRSFFMGPSCCSNSCYSTTTSISAMRALSKVYWGQWVSKGPRPSLWWCSFLSSSCSFLLGVIVALVVSSTLLSFFALARSSSRVNSGRPTMDSLNLLWLKFCYIIPASNSWFTWGMSYTASTKALHILS